MGVTTAFREEWETRRAWRAHVSRVLNADAPARLAWWAARPRAELLEEAARVLLYTPRAEFKDWPTRRLVSVLVNGHRARVLDLVNEGAFGKAAAELEQLTNRTCGRTDGSFKSR